MLVVFLVISAIAIGGIYIYATIDRLANRPVKPVDDDVSCIACGKSEDRWDVAPGVYSCLCGYEGGPGMRAHQWTKQVEALAKLSPEKRAARRQDHASRAGEVLNRVYETLSGIESHLITAGAAFLLTADGKRAARRAHSDASRLAGDARQIIHEALADVEMARHLATGADLMDDWRKRVDGGHGTMSGEGPEVAESIRTERARIQKLVKALKSEF
jgi:hypothetical protein